MTECKHMSLLFGGVDTVQFKYRQPSEQLRRDALTINQPANKKRKTTQKEQNESAPSTILPPEITFPAPIMIPGHELALDPKYPPQPVQEWLEADYRNKVSSTCRKIYVVAPPKVPRGLSYVERWYIPEKSAPANPKTGLRVDGDLRATSAPATNDVVQYLQAFYHGMDVKLLENPSLEWVEWEASAKPRKPRKGGKATQMPDCIGLSDGKELIRIASRPSPDGKFSGQLNQNHLLEVAIDILPDDAYALLMLVNHDLYEDENDDFCCGRAYGGSRVAVVSTARYRPELDLKQKIDREHVWPASHCRRYNGAFFSSKTPAGPPEDKKHCRNALEYHPGSAIAAGVVAHNELASPSSPTELTSLWLGRICKTASHEIGHCFGIDHCVYWACSMQGTACITEDHRQPPYLCPVDLAKVLLATGADEKERYNALLRFCDQRNQDRMFRAYGAWIRAALACTSASS